MNRLLLLLLAGCFVARETAAPVSLTSAETIPARPDSAMGAVIWTLNYDLRRFDEVWSWLHTLPPSAERSRAIGAAALIGVAELGRPELHQAGIDAFAEAIAAFPDDDRLPLWRTTMIFFEARNRKDTAAALAALQAVRAATVAYPEFTLFGITLSVAGWEDATPELIQEARTAFDTVVSATNELQAKTDEQSLRRSRRIFDSPIAPYNIPAMQAMIADLALRAGDKDMAPRFYYTALHANNAYRWPWRQEVERRLQNMDAVAAGLAARPATEFLLGSQAAGSLGVTEEKSDPRFSGRIGNGSCTVCHTHVSSFDLGEPAEEVGWVRGKALPVAGVPNLQPVQFLLPDGKDAIPAGFGIGPYVDVTAHREFDRDDSLFDGSFLIAAKPGRYFVALQATIDGHMYQGYSARELGLQWFVDVKAGVVTDLVDAPIRLTR